jgi:chromosome partitioning protein
LVLFWPDSAVTAGGTSVPPVLCLYIKKPAATPKRMRALTAIITFLRDSNARGTYELLLGHAKLPETVTETHQSGLFVIPTDARLAAAEVELVDVPNREFALKTALGPVAFDYVFIDCPPALSLLTVNALTAANSLLIPVQAEYYALEGLGQLMSVTQRVREGLNPQLELLGVLLTMYDSRTSLSEQVKQEVIRHFGEKVFDVVVPRNVRLAEAPSYGKSVFDHDKWSKGARAYKNVAKEVHKRASK